ncbi:hypothetical protein [Pyxidicoccus xibeiensis]|uniref:hypothetical protein n=1 Tax=Pyxidicoccus xibeiensis TaxID=2906759 RepID=UPI0020A7B22F|nr:hypothetical protein [Pyxidicoccus xibeiensis]MCP3140976.1 hypothetical protein [Pyxidicoccus xibeiensis]
MEQLLQFLTELTTNPFKRLAFQQDPLAAASAAGLEPWACAAVTQSSGGALALGAQAGGWQKCVFGLDPGPDPLEDPS